LPDFNPENPQVYFNIQVGQQDEPEFKRGTVVFELFAAVNHKTAEHFRCLCTREKGPEFPTYENTQFHRLVKGSFMQGGDTTKMNGQGGMSIYGKTFDDEGVWLPHSRKGLLSMANVGKNTNSSQF